MRQKGQDAEWDSGVFLSAPFQRMLLAVLGMAWVERDKFEFSAGRGKGRADPAIGTRSVEDVGGWWEIYMVDAILVGGGFPPMAVPVDVGFGGSSRRESPEKVPGIDQPGDPGRLVAGGGILGRRLRVVVADEDGGLVGSAIEMGCDPRNLLRADLAFDLVDEAE